VNTFAGAALRLVVTPALLGMLAAPASAQVVFEDDFNSGSAQPNWSTPSVFTAPSGETLLGRFDNTTVTLTLADLPSHDAVELSLRLWIMNTMDGNEPISIGVEGGALLLNTTFANFTGGGQFYPNPLNVGPMSPAGTGSIGGSNPLQMAPINGLDMGSTGYDLSFTFSHDAPSLTLSFSGTGMQGVGDESWGLDNVRVKVIPAPGAALTLASAMALGLRRRRA
jgi:hypothetical protein